MAIQDIDTKCYILALFIRDDGERFLLGSGRYEFKDKQRHFAANTIQNDVVEVQGNDGFLLAGQVKRPGSQSFDGYVGDGTTSKQEVEEYRRDFFSFFRKNFFYQVIYIFPDGTAIQRKRGFLVDAPAVQELYQIYPEYHVALNFEDVNYYSYSENASGEEEFAKSATISLSASGSSGGLVWDDFGAVAEGFQWGEIVTATGTEITVQNDSEGALPITDAKMYGDTYQQTYSGKNLLLPKPISSASSGLTASYDATTGVVTLSGTASKNWSNAFGDMVVNLPAGTYTFSATTEAGLGRNIIFFNGSTNILQKSLSAAATSVECVVPEAITSLRLWLSPTNGTDYTGKTFKAQLEIGSQATSFEPYVGGIPAPNPDYPQDIQVVTGRQVVKTHGKNLFDNDMKPTTTIGDDRLTVQALPTGIRIIAGKTASGSNYSAGVFIIGKKSEYLGKTLTFSCNYTTSTTNTSRVYLATCNASAGNRTVKANSSPLGTGSGSYSIGWDVVDDDANEYLCLGLYATATGSIRVGDYIDYTEAQLEVGEATEYQRGATTYELNLGKNLFDKDNENNFLRNLYFDSEHTTIARDNVDGRNVSICIPCSPNTTYTIQKIVAENKRQIAYTTEKPAVGVQTYGMTQNQGWTTQSFTTGANAKYLCLRLWISTQDTISLEKMLSSVQIELGPTATPYAPYFDPIELCKIGDYQDYIYKSGNDWYLHKEIEAFDLSTGAYVATTGSIRGLTNAPNIRYVPNNQTIGSAVTSGYRIRQGQGLGTAGAGWFAVDTNRVNFNTGGSTDPVGILYYALATPTDTQITNQALIEDLNGLAGASFRTGESQLVVSASGNLVGELEISYYGSVDFEGSGFVWEEGGPSGPTTVEVDSIENVYPIWEVKGPATNPQLSVLTTNTTLRYNGTVAAGQTLTIDMMSKTAKLNGTSVIGNVSGEWVNFVPGNNRVVYTTNNANAESSTIYWQEVVG